MPKKDDLLVAVIFAVIAGLVFAYFALKIVAVPSELAVLGFVFAWILGSTLMFLFIVDIGRHTADKNLRGIEADIDDFKADLPRYNKQY